METFSALLAICAGNSPVPGEFPAQRPVTRSFDVFFDLHPNKRLNKQWLGWWFETPSCPLRGHRNDHVCSLWDILYFHVRSYSCEIRVGLKAPFINFYVGLMFDYVKVPPPESSMTGLALMIKQRLCCRYPCRANIKQRLWKLGQDICLALPCQCGRVECGGVKM